MLPYIIAILFLPAVNLEDVDTIPKNRLGDYRIEYHFYSSDKFDYPDVLTFGNDDALAASSIKPRDGTYIYIHGFRETVFSEGPQTILMAHVRFMDCNVILVDWSSMSRISYHFQSAPSVPTIGRRIARMIQWLEYHEKITVSDLHVIGFSLGAHIAGHVGKSLAPKQIRRITGLDPAYPCFMHKPTSQRLHHTDAQFVDVIHTNADFLGMQIPIGHADFYPNEGGSQPGCWFFDIKCSHHSAWRYYAESLSNPYRFLGFECEFDYYTLYNCVQHGTTLMGYHANPEMHGIFYVET